jgi:predicted Rossmann fold nucleotide-binding protein DprA/Smf involved in DNA uptake
LHHRSNYQPEHFPLLPFSCYKGSDPFHAVRHVENAPRCFYARIRRRPYVHTQIEIRRIGKSDPEYPASLMRYLSSDAPDSAAAMGNLQVLKRRKLAIFSSAVCPAELTSAIHELTQKLAVGGVTAIGGFHSPVERECLKILLGGTRPIILSPARSLDKLRIRSEYRKAFDQGRLLFLSFFRSHRHRSDVEMAFRRNRFVAALADIILFLHAAPASNTERLCREVISWQKSIYTIDHEANQNLVQIGAQAVNSDSVSELVFELGSTHDTN